MPTTHSPAININPSYLEGGFNIYQKLLLASKMRRSYSSTFIYVNKDPDKNLRKVKLT